MPRPTKRQLHLARIRLLINNANELRNEIKEQETREQITQMQNPPTYIYPRQMAVGCLMAGTNPSKFREVANFCNCKTCSMSAFYNAQNEVIPDIMDVADETVYEAR